MTLNTGPHQFEMDAWISCAPFERLLNVTIVQAEDGSAVLTMPFLMDFAQGAGLLHGGALVGLADTAVVMAIKSILPPGTHFATTSLEVKFLNPVRQGTVRAEAQVVSREGRIFRGVATIYNDAEVPVLNFSSVFKVARNSTILGIKFKDLD
ncbi:MAG: PaaI family thioesterase [Deltaproteobacteria bacterium]|nr:PaaI family thioesterase [Deltaproteobacteria bacterium]MBF0523979.1 PaaI family thioesterase [Deltaproteobacteria bacterium]